MEPRTFEERLRRLERRLTSADRFVDALLVIVSHDGEELLRAGGCWDTRLKRYVDRPCKAHVVRLEESQLEMGRSLARWLDAQRKRVKKRIRVLIGGGNRGSGKTWFLAGVGFVIMALEFPRDWMFGVNITAKQKRECIEAIKEVAPIAWLSNDINDFRDPRTVFLTGATVAWLSAQNPRAIRQAGLRIRYILINEGQDQPESVANNCIAAIRNTGGLVGVATNPPQTERSDWVANWWTGIEAGELNGERYFVDNKKNRSIDQDAVGDIAAFLYATSQEAGDADGAGVFRLSGPVAYPAFIPLPLERGGHVGDPPPPPDVGAPLYVDVTAELTGSAVDSGTGFPYICAVDFQRQPGVIGSIIKLYRASDGRLVMHVMDTIGVRGVEGDFSQALHAAGYRPVPGMDGPTVLLVGDGTGARQNAEHRKGQPTSFLAMRADGWKIVGPMKHWKNGIWWNPLVKESRAQMHELFTSRQILISPKCKEASEGFPSLVTSFRSAKVGPKGGLIEKGNYQHGCDGVRYAAWRFLPRPMPVKPNGFDHATYDAVRHIKILTSG